MKNKIIAVKKIEGNIVQVKLDDESVLTIEEAIIRAKKGLIENINTGLNIKQNKQKALSNRLYDKLDLFDKLPLF